MQGSIKILHKKCDTYLAKNKSLPINSYLICYCDNGEVFCDIAQGSRFSIFDCYYDQYRKVISINWTDGRINPRVYGESSKKNKK